MSTVVVPLVTPSDNERKIPRAVFIENVEELAKQYGSEEVLKQLNELYSKYKFMEAQLLRTKQVLKSKLPDITNALQMVDHLTSVTSDITVDFQVADNIWSKANIPITGRVGLWLGSNVMLEYPYDEAKELLEINLGSAQKSLASTDDDLKFLKEQLTTCEVNIARVYNFNVTAKRQAK